MSYPVGSFAYRPAVYDGWVYVKGTGILDRRSFVGPRTVATGPTGPGAARQSPPASAGDRPPPLPLALGAGGLILIAAIGALVELLRRR